MTPIRIRIALGAGLLVLVTALSLVRTVPPIVGLIGSGQIGRNSMITLAEARFRSVKGSLPPLGVYGYRAPGPLTIDRDYEIEGDDVSILHYVLAQYVLAPRVLDLDRARPPAIRDDLEPAGVSLPGGP